MDEHTDSEISEAKTTRPIYTLFPKHWDAKEIYDFHVDRAETIEEMKNKLEGRIN